jgi:hypothetical protein
MLSATILAIFLIPLFFVMVRGWFKSRSPKGKPLEPAPAPVPGDA